MKFILQRHVHHSIGSQKEKTIATSDITGRGPKGSFPDIWVQFTLGQPKIGRGRTHSLGAKKSWGGSLSHVCVGVCTYASMCCDLFQNLPESRKRFLLILVFSNLLLECLFKDIEFRQPSHFKRILLH